MLYGNEPLNRKAQRTPAVRLRFGKRDSSLLENEVRDSKLITSPPLCKYLIFHADFMQFSCEKFSPLFACFYDTLLLSAFRLS